MNCTKRFNHIIIGFLIGNIFLATMIFGMPFVSGYFGKWSSEINFAEALRLIETREVREIHVKRGEIIFYENGKSKYLNSPTAQEIDSIVKKVPGEQIRISYEKNSLQTVHQTPAADDWLPYLFQILFWLFFISPPLIVILLLVIIKKMDEKKEKMK